MAPKKVLYFAFKLARDPMGYIIIKDRGFSFSDIRNGKWQGLDPYYEDTLQFCKDWLTGKNSFELQTSGSTGQQKSIQVERSRMVSSAKATADFFGFTETLTLLCCLNTGMIAGKMMLVRALEWNSNLHLVKPSSNPFLNLSPSQVLDFVALVPYQLEVSLENPENNRLLHRVKTLILGGAPISFSLKEKASHLPGNIFQTYGMTETVSHIALANLKTPGKLVYNTLPGVKIRLSSENILEIKAPMSKNSWISTNDIVEMVSESSFYWKGRSDFAINTGGVKIQPEIVEAIIGESVNRYFPGCRFFVGSRNDSMLGQKAILLVEGGCITTSQANLFLSQLKEILPKYQNPKELHFVENFIETDSGKINRRETVSKLFGNDNI